LHRIVIAWSNEVASRKAGTELGIGDPADWLTRLGVSPETARFTGDPGPIGRTMAQVLVHALP
jgi:hypothetical protein